MQAIARRANDVVGDNRELPLRTWDNIYERVSATYTYWWGLDELGADDDADPDTGLKGKTVGDIQWSYWGIDMKSGHWNRSGTHCIPDGS